MKKELTELVFILDESGSMSGLEKDTIGGFNSLIEKQKNKKGDVVVTTVLFNVENKIIQDRVNINEVKLMTNEDYTPNNCTALLDAVGTTINRINEKRKELKEEYIPTKTMVVITTDGFENSSVEYDYKDIKKLIGKQKELGWEFIFLGANIDAPKEAERFGIDECRAATYKCDSKGVNLNFEILSEAIEMHRKDKLSDDWKKKIEEDFTNRN